MIEDCTAIILAGGASLRMGSDKADLRLGEQTLLQRVIAALRPVFPQMIVSVREQRAGVDVPQVCDAVRNGGPLAGLSAALEQATTPWAFAVACDMPFVKPALIEALARCRGRYQAVVPVVQGQPQPLAAFYASSCVAVVRENLSTRDTSLRSLLQQLDVCYVDQEMLAETDPGLRSFFDLDTPQDFATALHEVK